MTQYDDFLLTRTDLFDGPRTTSSVKYGDVRQTSTGLIHMTAKFDDGCEALFWLPPEEFAIAADNFARRRVFGTAIYPSSKQKEASDDE